MKTALVRTTVATLVCCLCSTVWAQSPGPFGSPSVLQSGSAYNSWQAPTGYYPQTQMSVASITPMANMAPAPPAAQKVPQNAVPDAVGTSPAADAWCDTGCCDVGCGPSWYAAASGLIFTRNRPKFSQLSFDDTNLVGQVLSTNSGLGQWNLGMEFRLGWYLDPCSALEFTYWGVYGDDEEQIVYGANLPGNMNSALDFSPLNIGATNVNDLYDAAAAHRVRRDYDVNDLELNFISGRLPWSSGDGLQLSYLAGVRYLRFAEAFQYASADAQPVFGADMANEAYYNIDVSNDLWGFQLGGRADWNWTPRFSIYTATKFGIYGNQMRQHSLIYNVNGIAVVGPGNPLVGTAFDIATNKTYTSFVGELDLGLAYQLTPRWNAFLGYRAVAVSGVAFATDQIPGNLADIPGVADVDGNATLVLHGGYAGVAYTW